MYNMIRRQSADSRMLDQYNKLSTEEQEIFNESNITSSDIGIFKPMNNKWGEWKLKKAEKYVQNIFKLNNSVGWNYLTPNKNRGVIGYPELFIGKSPWGGDTTNIEFPKKIEDIKTLEAIYDVSMYVEAKKYNLVFDLWVTKNIRSTMEDMSHEIMIWEDRNVAMPAGKFIRDVNTPSGVYKMYHTWMDRTSENFGIDGWYFTAFIRKEGRRSGTVDLKEFINVMVAEGVLDQKHYISTVEFGNEIYNACGYTIVNDYNLKIEDVNKL